MGGADAGVDAGSLVDAGVDAGPVADGGPPADAAVEAGTDAGAAPLTGTIVPLYTYPTDATWTDIATAASAHPSVRVVAVINPNNGPTATVDAAYASGISALQAAGVVVIGYVATGYGTRATSAVDADVDRYVAQYPSLDGIFFDEAAIYETGHETTYTEEATHARDAGYAMLVANPGTTPDAAYEGLFDVAMVYESDGAPAESVLAQFAPHREASAIIPYAVASLDASYLASIRPDVAYVYLTDDDLPNPWDTLPSYFDALLTGLE